MPQGPLLNFDRVEPGKPPSMVMCSFCGRAIDDLQFEIVGEAACDICVRRVVAQLPVNNRRTFLRSLGAGVLTAIGASLLYMLLSHILPESFGWTFVVLAGIGIGWAFGKAMHWAARDAGVRRYQWTGSILAYASVVYSLHTILLGAVATPSWSFPLILLGPIAFLFTEMKSLGTLEITAAFLAIRWAWSTLRKTYASIREIRPAQGAKPSS